jgi:hypothetical protein
MNTTQKAAITLLLLAVVISPMVQAGFSLNANTTDKVVGFIHDVAGIDTASYKVMPISNTQDYPSNYGGLQREFGSLNLESADSNIEVTYTYINGSLISCNLYDTNGSPKFTDNKDMVSTAKAFLQNYGTFAGVAYTKDMPPMLNTADATTNSSTVSGSIKLSVTTVGNFTTIAWFYTANGIDYPSKGLGINFENGVFCGFGDGWNLYKIGQSKISVSKDEAIKTAMASASNYTLVVATGPESETEVKFNIDPNHVDAVLTTVPREPMTLYPIWTVQLYFDKTYFDQYGFQARIWADSNGVASFVPTGIGGDLPTSTAPTDVVSTISPNSQNTQSHLPATNVILFAIIALFGLMSAGILILKARRK